MKIHPVCKDGFGLDRTLGLPGLPDLLSSYRFHLGVDLARPEHGSDEALFKAFWHHTDAIVCCAWKGMREFVFANRSGLLLSLPAGVRMSSTGRTTTHEQGPGMESLWWLTTIQWRA